MSKGDKISVFTKSQTVTIIEARQNGRRLEIASDKEGGVQFVVVKEITRGGTAVRTVRVAASELLMLDADLRE